MMELIRDTLWFFAWVATALACMGVLMFVGIVVACKAEKLLSRLTR